MTPQLLDKPSLQAFKKVAFEDGLGWKLVAVVNRMTQEGGSRSSRPEDRIKEYRQDLKTKLQPYDMDEIEQCYIDAQLYLKGCRYQSEPYKNASCFSELVAALDKMIGMGRLAKLPFNAVQAALDNLAARMAASDPAEEPYLFLLDQLSRAAQRTRRQLKSQSNSIVTRLGSEIVDAAEIVCDGLENAGTPEALRRFDRQAQAAVSNARTQATEQLQELFDRQAADLKERVSSVCDGPLGSEFILYLDRVGALDTGGVAVAKDGDIFGKEARDKVTQLAGILGDMGEKASGGLEQVSKNSEGIRKLIYSAGKKAGKKFKPHGAATPAKKVAASAGKASKYLKWAKFVGPAIEGLNIAADIREDVQNEKRERALEQQRQKIRRAFDGHAHEHEMRFREIVEDAAEELFQNTELLIAQARSKEEARIAGKDGCLKELADIRSSVTRLLVEARTQSTS
ncbi:MAG: hypothetical protein HN341_05190 [Verrucomicrobia bacterium]|nr:hypothetical protein [Verrucomicrobiota bacterium]